MEKERLKTKANGFSLIGKFMKPKKKGKEAIELNLVSKTSDYTFNRMNLGIYCGERYGTVFTTLMGGYFPTSRDSIIYCKGKDENGNTDWSKNIQVAWEDRMKESILKEVSNFNFYTCALELDTEGKLVYKNFLSAYDMIEYVNDHLNDGDVVSISGNIRYDRYNGKTTRKLEPKKIIKSFVEKKDDFSENKYFYAHFNQTIIFNKDSIGDYNKDTREIEINAYVPQYFGKDVKETKALPFNFVYQVKEGSDEGKLRKLIRLLFPTKKGYSYGTYNGEIVESGSTVETTVEDLPEEFQLLIKYNALTEEEALATCATSSGNEKKMIIKNPKPLKDKDGKVTGFDVVEDMYDEDIIDFDFLRNNEEDDDLKEEKENDDAVEKAEKSSDESLDEFLDDILDDDVQF